MPFHFSLESLLRLRSSEQRHYEFVLQKQNSEVNRLRRQISLLKQEVLRITSAPANGRFGAELQFENNRQLSLQANLIAVEKQLTVALEQQSLAAAELRKSWQRQETLAVLSRRDRDIYLYDNARKDQQQQDDWFLRRKSSR